MKEKDKKEKLGIKVILLCLCFLITIGLLIASSKPKVEEEKLESELEEVAVKELPKVYFDGDISKMESKSDVRKIRHLAKLK